MRLLAIGLFLAVCLMGVHASHAQDKTSGEAIAKLKSATELTTLDAPGIHPWHWKMDVTLFDSDGKNPQTGSIEVWFADGNMRTILTLGTEQLTTLRVADKLYRTDGDSTKFVPLEIVWMNALEPIPAGIVQSATKIKLVTQPVGKIKLNCVQPDLVQPDPNTFSAGMPLSYCFSQDTDRFVAVYQSSQIILRTQTGLFQAHQVPEVLQFFFGSTKRAEAKTTVLSTFVPAADDFAISSTLKPLGDTVEVPMASLSSMRLNNVAPHYPESAKSRHVAGSVKFDVIIGANGRVISSQVANKADSDLINAAKEAISQWVYRPYLVNGIPVQEKSTVTLNFNLGN